ncbi:MAG: PD-(D/E)XK nuclease family protein [Candidatus Adiutrix sp.]|jgi:hypothetical protein|nr:PD-(D/E)XK nuclease family protein [Candidatus Adiutrix sp.]
MIKTTIRASSLPGLFDCPARWEAVHIQGKRMPSSGKAMLGTAVHKSTAVYDESRLKGEGLTADEAAGAAVDVLARPGEDVVWEDDLNPATAEKIALGLHGLYCAQIAPAADYVAVEATCEALTIADLGITLTGTVDRIQRTDDGLGIADIKTGGQVVGTDGRVKTAGHAFQIGVYEILAEAATGQPMSAPAKIIGLQTGKTPKGQRAGIGRIEGARAALVGSDDVPGVLEMAAKLINSGAFFGNPRSMMCHSRYCPIYNNCKSRR